MSLEQSQLKREEKLIAMGQMAASLAHEIRNPLGSMELNIGLLKRTLNDNEQASSYLMELQRSVRTLNHIVTNSLQFTKDVVPRKQNFNSGKILLGEICVYLGNRFDVEKNLYVGEYVDIQLVDKGSKNFSLDPYLIGQVILNLLSNAIQASEENLKDDSRGLVVLTLDHSAEDSFFISIADDGQGISPENIEQIFDPFFTTKEKGTGLGLAIVHSIISAHKAKIEVENRAQSGAEFKVTFRN